MIFYDLTSLIYWTFLVFAKLLTKTHSENIKSK